MEKKQKIKNKVYNNLKFKVPNGVLTPETLWSLGRIGEIALSPDKSTILFTTTWFNIKKDNGIREIYSLPANGGEVKQLTFNKKNNEHNIAWRPDGKKIGYLSNKSGSSQIWEMNPDGSDPKMISEIKDGINSFCYAPDMSHIAYTKNVKVGKNVPDNHPDLPKANARIVDNLMYRHWDSWVDNSFSHLFIATYNKKKVGKGVDIMPNEPWEAPVRPFGGMEQITWSPDSKLVIYTCRKKSGKAYATSTNTDLYAYNLQNKATTNLTKGMKGYDRNPVFSPSGKYLAFESMERDGYEADVNRMAILDLNSGHTHIYNNTDLNIHNIRWSQDESAIYFISNWHARDHIYRYEVSSEKINKITSGDYDYQWFELANDQIITTRMSISKPTEIYAIRDGAVDEISFINKPILSQLNLGKVEERWIKTTDDKEELVWVIFPPNFDPTKKYPTLLYCQGGPQGTVSQFWSYRWNFQMMAANGYIIVAPNRRGLPGFGKEWNEQISGDYGGQNMKDYLSAIDAVAEKPYVDKNRLGAVGASYGGFSVYWLAGNHNKRFKAFIAHDGMFHFESMYLETEEMWFVNWDIGGPFWDKENQRAQKSYTFSPHHFVENWDTPIMVIQGGKDYRVTESQAFMAFNAAKLRDIPAKLLYFPEENHWVLSAQNGILWQRTFFEWLDKWLK